MSPNEMIAFMTASGYEICVGRRVNGWGRRREGTYGVDNEVVSVSSG